MKKAILSSILCVLALATLAWAGEPSGDAGVLWPQWRGPSGSGTAAHGDPPVEWSETRNVRWKIDLPGKGSSSPIVWGDRIYVTTAVPVEGGGQASAPPAARGRRQPPIEPSAQKFVVLAIDRKDGHVVWQKTVREERPSAGTHPTGTWASNSPITDGTHLYAYFGSRGLYCLDMDGNVLWERDFGEMKKRRDFGEGSSPVLLGDKIFILWDHEGPSFLFALDKKTGKDVWKVSRDEISSWSTPLAVEHEGTPQIVTNATGQVVGYHADTGEVLWHASGMTVNVIPTPVIADGTLVVTSGFRGAALLAIRLAEARGDITGSDAITWSLEKDTPYTPSPLLHEGTLYLLKTNSAVLSSFDAQTGKEHYRAQRLEGLGNIYSSPVGVADRLYVTDRDGNTLVIRHGPKFEVLATNSLDDGFDASMAVVGDEILLRGQKHLYSIAADD